MPSKLSKFWKELKRRRVVHVITVYASAAFVIIELINNLAEPLNLPPSLLTIVVIVLAVGFPLAVILSWLYDVTSKGVEKTKPIEELKEGEKTVVPNAWKIATYVSFVVIFGLAVLNIVGGSNQLRAGDIQSLVILPFENYTGDEQLDNMVSSMHSILIGDMGRVSGLRVIGKTSSKMYKDATLSATEIARELNVEGVVEATVTCMGDSVCMQFRLINASGKEALLWVGDYTEDKGEILNLYNRITKQIAAEVRIELTPEEHQFLSRSQSINKEAFDAYLKSYAHWDDLSEEGTKKGIEYLNAAVEKDPDWAPLYTGLAQLWGILVQMGSEAPETGMPKVFGYMDQAMELDPDFADIHFNKAVFGTWLEWDWTKGEKEFLEALAINPSDAMSRIYYAHLLAILQQNDEAIIQGRIAMEIDPQNPLIHALYAAVFMMTRDWEAAMDQLEKALALDPGHFFALQFMDVVAFHLGDYDLALQAFKGFLPFPETFFDSINTLYREQGFDAAYEKVVLEMVNTGYGVPFDYAMRYLLLNQYDKALDWLEIGYEVNDPNMPYIGTGFNSIDSLYDHPRILAIMDKMNLPLPAE